jgi:hypothetical protein
MQCPTDNEVGLALGIYRRGNYVANSGIGPLHSVNDPKDPTRIAGPFTMNSSTRMADFTDGTTNTIAVAELLKSPGDDFRGVMHYPEGSNYQHDQTPNSSVPDQFRSSLCVSIPRAPCTGVYSAYNDRAIVLAARSQHVGGVQVMMADGSVRFISNNIHRPTWQALGTPNGSEVMGEF